MPESFLFPAAPSRIIPLRPPQAVQAAVAQAGGAPPATGPATASSDAIAGFTVPHQEQTNWCWAAVSLAVDTYYAGANWTQCTLAGATLGFGCCSTPLPDGCDVPYYLDRSLTCVGRFDRYVHGSALYSTVQTEISGRRALCCRIQWSLNAAHFVAISNWSIDANGTQWVGVQDPGDGYNFQTFSDFANSYKSAGTWSDTYFTRRTATPAAGAPPLTPIS
jgi:Papain-like cysteine protease AvrRpt2